MAAVWRISLFAGLAERFGSRSVTAEWPEARLTAGQIKDRLMELYPKHADIISIAFLAQNQSYAHDDAEVGREDELALLPPVSGGSGEQAGTGTAIGPELFTVVEHPIDVNGILDKVYHPDHGAAIAFVGATREWTAGKRTVTLEYEAYVPMAVSSMKQIGDEISAKWPGTLTAIEHRIGTVGIGEISVVIAVSSAHRAEAYEASRYAIERLKQTVPIWKKEVYEDGTEWKGHQLGPWNPLQETP
ncbi:molybdopterin converting factor [Cohnella pontilimi]|uniref:Molybdopterin synthase catalytic subunit n=1 Tax=Cohnella pontilimi TaxID=2564100 RepID=A0A4V5LS29_9BACL|nr:molybdenum cofactor biosynthesis protein MoaE [Cohnella pontilimi]TJY41499.1 molybdopterin converting factor [Cohnella pontilimi]